MINPFSWFWRKKKVVVDRPILAYVSLIGPDGTFMMPVYEMYTKDMNVVLVVDTIRTTTITRAIIYSPQMICLAKQLVDLTACSGDQIHFSFKCPGE